MTSILLGSGFPATPHAVGTRDEPRGAAPFSDVLQRRAGRTHVASGFLADTPPIDVALTPYAQADAFNADGFFQGPTQTFAASLSVVGGTPAPIRTTASDERPPIGVAAIETSDVPDAMLGLRGGEATLAPGALASATASIAAPMTAATLPITTPRATDAAFASSTAIVSRSGDPRLPADNAIVAGRRPFERLLAERGAALATRVAVTAVEQGIQVAIHVDRLDWDERVRLRDRVAALLSRYGLTASDIRLNGNSDDTPVRPAREQ